MVKNIYYGKKFIEKNDLRSLVKFSTKKCESKIDAKLDVEKTCHFMKIAPQKGCTNLSQKLRIQEMLFF